MIDAIASGLLAGLAVAMPLGAVGVLILSTAMRHGARAALPAGLAVASVDGLYALGGALGGQGLADVLAAREGLLRAAAAAVLAAVGAVGLVRGIRAWRRSDTVEAAAGPAPRAGPLYARFFALTATNPPTLATFAAVFLALGTLDGAGASLAFAAGALGASAAWHVVLVTAGGAAGRRLGPRARAATLVGGPVLVLVLAALAVGGG